MKILSAEQIRAADAYTIENEPIASIDLMERASQACEVWIKKYVDRKTHIHVFCGKGNNGGDGLAITRLLHEEGYRVNCHIIHFIEFGSKDFNTNKERLYKNGIEWNDIHKLEDIPILGTNDLIIDAIFGSGLNRPAEGIASEVIKAMNASGVMILSIDIPSGMYCDDNSANLGNSIVKATHTLTFQVPKLALLLPENSEYSSQWHLLDIGLDKQFISEQATNNLYTTKEYVLALIGSREKFSHKGSHGHVFLVSGTKGKMGATILSARACLRSGVGLLTVHSPNCGYEILQESVPEAMVDLNVGDEHLKGSCKVEKRTVGIGPGIGTNEETAKFLEQLLDQCRSPIVIDADALNLLSSHLEFLSKVPENSILTPHPGEFKGLVGAFQNDTDKLKMLRSFCADHKVIMVLKGAHTAICEPSGIIHFNSTGNPGMATGGSGDVLTGIITGLLAQGQAPINAAILGVYIHGLSGDLAVKETGERSLVAGDLVQHIAHAYLELERS
ncbi:MAG: NAD(P)H-hydrate dehydratase [Flavobacteriales bacterium]|nr:NAD(P)H-hydrate dehydratase [Flavobacteriales bacterium]